MAFNLGQVTAKLITPVEDETHWEPEYTHCPEDVVFEIEDDELGRYGHPCIHSIEASDGSNATGYVSMEHDTGGCLDYMISGCIPDSTPRGFYIALDCDVDHYRGDGWTTDDGADFYPGLIRPATMPEIAEACGEGRALWWLRSVENWGVFLRQVRLHLLYLWGRLNLN